MNGKIKFFSEEKGYGFIIGEDEEEYYFNIHGIKNFDTPPRMGDIAVFDVKATKKQGMKPTAINVKISKSSESGENRTIVCPHCGKQIVPRMRFLNGTPYSTLCPFCGGEIKAFYEESKYDWGSMFWLIFGVILIGFLWLATAIAGR